MSDEVIIRVARAADDAELVRIDVATCTGDARANVSLHRCRPRRRV
jgi:hypothetical protein